MWEIGCFFVTLQLSNGSMAEWSGSRTCNQQVAGSNSGRCAAECNSGKVALHTCVSFTKQYNLVPANGR